MVEEENWKIKFVYKISVFVKKKKKNNNQPNSKALVQVSGRFFLNFLVESYISVATA